MNSYFKAKVNFIDGSILGKLYLLNSNDDSLDSDESDSLDITLVSEDIINQRDQIDYRIERVATECLYKAPVIGTSLEQPGIKTNTTSPTTFQLSNPPVTTCSDSVGSNIKIHLKMEHNDFNRLENEKFDRNQKLTFILIQQIAGDDPDYHGFLVKDPNETDENGLNLCTLEVTLLLNA